MSSSFEEPTDGRNDDYWYNYGHDALGITAETYAIDDREPGAHGLRRRRLVLDDFEWDELTLHGKITVSEGLPEHVFGSDTDPGTLGRLFIRGDCIATHNRFVATEIGQFDGSGEFGFELTLSRDLVADSVELEPILVRESEQSTGDLRYGQTPGLRLADGESFEVATAGDEESETFLPIETRPFEEVDRENQVFYLDHSVASEPKLYVNSDIELLVRALKTRAPHGSKRWTKETLQRLIAQPAWVELVLWAASDVTDGECQYQWQETVVALLAESRGRAPSGVAERLEAQIDDSDRVDTLVEEANESVQRMLETDRPLERLLKEVL